MIRELDTVQGNDATSASRIDARANIGSSVAVSSERPTYQCPECRQPAMQFYSQLPEDPRRTEVFCCCACGSLWDV